LKKIIILLVIGIFPICLYAEPFNSRLSSFSWEIRYFIYEDGNQISKKILKGKEIENIINGTKKLDINSKNISLSCEFSYETFKSPDFQDERIVPKCNLNGFIVESGDSMCFKFKSKQNTNDLSTLKIEKKGSEIIVQTKCE
jgi:hypothetical protein